jgi:hypothetical protein
MVLVSFVALMLIGVLLGFSIPVFRVRGGLERGKGRIGGGGGLGIDCVSGEEVDRLMISILLIVSRRIVWDD